MDPIDELVQASLDRKIKGGSPIEACTRGCGGQFHGLRRGTCPGPFLDDEAE